MIENNKCIIYGAGMAGNLVRQYCEIVGCEKNIISFAISEQPTEKLFHGYRLCSIDELSNLKNECEVLIATFPAYQDEIETRLHNMGFNNIIKLDFAMYQKMTSCYIDDFIQHKKFADNYDILYMASDNNRTSGAFLCLADLAKDINKIGLHSLVVLPEYGTGEQLLIENGVDYTYVPSKTWLKRVDGKELTWQEKTEADNDKAVSAIENLIERLDIKIVHCNTTYANVGAIAAKNKGIPVVWHLREIIQEQGYNFENENEFYGLINSSDKIIAVSNFLEDNYPQLNLAKCGVIYDGVDSKKYAQEKTILKNETLRILMLGAIYPLKRQEDLIDAAVYLTAKGIAFRIEFIGSEDATYASELKRKAEKLNLADKIFFLGRKNNVEEYYRNADIVVSCSGVESFGRVAVEAAMAGCLVICANRGGSAELFEDKADALLFEYGDGLSLATAIEFAINNKIEARRIASAGHRKSLGSYTKENCSQQIYKLYQSLSLES